jgi:serine/threonine protein kinase
MNISSAIVNKKIFFHNIVSDLAAENLGKDWPLRYGIIKGICKGLKYLQQGLEFPIFHLDLKPDNILLNEEMAPKISDFGLSRLIGEENSKRTLTPLGTM